MDYCRLVDGKFLRAVDDNKDQSYFLSQVSKKQLKNVLFPVGDLIKSEVRKIALEYGLVTAHKKDSTGICFIGKRNLTNFLKNYLPNIPGDIVNIDTNEVIGKHIWLMYYTIGQKIKCFEIDKAEMIENKIKRLEDNNINISNIDFIKADFTNNKWFDNVLKSSYDKSLISFNSLLGISYYLTKKEFDNMIYEISNNICEGSSILFDYQTDEYSKETIINEKLASATNEKMKAKYTYSEMEKLLSNNNMQIYEYLNDKDITNNFFYDYNTLNPNNKIVAPKGVAYILVVKK